MLNPLALRDAVVIQKDIIFKLNLQIDIIAYFLGNHSYVNWHRNQWS